MALLNTRDTGWIPDFMSWFGADPLFEYDLEAARRKYPALAGLTDDQLNALLKDTEKKRFSFLGNSTYRTDDALLNRSIEEMLQALSEEPQAVYYTKYLDSARDSIAAENSKMYADLDKLLANRTSMYNQQMADISDSYDRLRSDTLSQHYQQNAQLMDSLQSGMDRSRRNALEAGASAGIRIADNINTLLSVQNKQSASAMETSNQLAQMMVNRRNAEQSARSDYANALESDTAKRHDLQLSSEQRASSLANTNYNAASTDYSTKKAEWEKKNWDNPLYEYRHQLKY